LPLFTVWTKSMYLLAVLKIQVLEWIVSLFLLLNLFWFSLFHVHHLHVFFILCLKFVLFFLVSDLCHPVNTSFKTKDRKIIYSEKQLYVIKVERKFYEMSFSNSFQWQTKKKKIQRESEKGYATTNQCIMSCIVVFLKRNLIRKEVNVFQRNVSGDPSHWYFKEIILIIAPSEIKVIIRLYTPYINV